MLHVDREIDETLISLTRRGLFAGTLATLLMAADADARKKKRRKKKRRRRRKKRRNRRRAAAAVKIIRPSGWPQSQLNEDVQAAYERWKSRYLVAENDGLYRVAKGKSGADHDVTVSEGQGFGMMIVASMAGYDPEAREICEGLCRFALAHPSKSDPRLMDWEVPNSSPNSGDDSAFDGDADLAYGLLMAASTWGNNGPVAFRDQFNTRLAGIKMSTIGPQSKLPMLGDWVDPNGGQYNQYTPRSSDLMAGHFHTFARATGDKFWNQVASACQSTIATLQADFSPATGLLPDFIQPRSAQNHKPRPASPKFLEEEFDGDYFYNAGRDPWRIGADAVLHGDATSAAQAAKIARWAKATTNGDPTAFKSGYYLDGSPLPNSDYFSLFFVAPLGVAAMCDPDLQSWLNDIYEVIVGTTDQDYYEESVALLCLLLMTGNFQDPTR